jgi:hypothetical protein
MVTYAVKFDDVEASSGDNNGKYEIDKNDNYEYKWGTKIKVREKVMIKLML